MSKIPFQLTKETIVGLSIFIGVFLLFIVNAYFVVLSLLDVYAAPKVTTGASAIDDSVLSQAVQIIHADK